MPYKKSKSKSKSKKKTTFRRKTYRKKYVRIARPRISSSGLPPNYPIQMKYADIIPLTIPAAGVPYLYQFRLNSIQDPDLTGAGHQPYFRDQMIPFYDYYKVRSCYVKLVIQSLDNSRFIISVRPDDNATAVSNLTLEMERPGASTILFSEIAKPLNFKKRYMVNTILKMPLKEYLDDETLKTSSGSNPTLPCILNILIANADTTSLLTSQVSITAVLQYDLMLQDLTVQPQS